jgi:hypothetical protein
MMNWNQLYELSQIREQEYMMDAAVRRSAGRRNRRRTARLIIGATRRLRRRAHSPQD